ncbi:hypothetical protein N0V83_002998 [Neocucurbitaria cava]|uniref:Uncharacterized protein n=1 Tax=Neocucurbitaria cava TaxID=798079 RepID=A0A9W8YCV6_9PLEO|nr:hypothetical protein N0V83_002998 [Neocucurbitaria cava]
MSRHVSVSRNFVNLGKLYGFHNGDVVPYIRSAQVPINFVNLGNLYSPTKNQWPPSWAYFEDGSVCIFPYKWLPHGEVERRMNLAAQFVNNPTPKIQVIRQQDPQRGRLILIKRHLTSAQFMDAPQLPLKRLRRRLQSSEALETFRGTLVNRTLQPNFRLGNGLVMSSNPDEVNHPVRGIRRIQDDETKALRESPSQSEGTPATLVHQLPNSPSQNPSKLARRVSQDQEAQGREKARPVRKRGSPPPLDSSSFGPEQDIKRREAEVARRERELIQIQQQLLLQTTRKHNERNPRDAAPRRSHLDDMEAEEQEPKQRVKILQLKRKPLALERQLAMDIEGDSSPTRVPHHNDLDSLLHELENGHIHSLTEETSSEPQHEEVEEESAPAAFDINDAEPPAALAKLRSRIQSPTRRTLRSKREPRPR